MSGIGSALKSLVGEIGSLVVKAAQAQKSSGGNTPLMNAAAVSSMAQTASTPTQQQALFMMYSTPALTDLYGQLPHDQQEFMAAAFTRQLQSPGGAAAALNGQRAAANYSAEALFKANASPAQLSQYNQMPPDAQRWAQANMLLNVYGGSALSAPPVPANAVPSLGSLLRALKG